MYRYLYPQILTRTAWNIILLQIEVSSIRFTVKRLTISFPSELQVLGRKCLIWNEDSGFGQLVQGKVRRTHGWEIIYLPRRSFPKTYRWTEILQIRTGYYFRNDGWGQQILSSLLEVRKHAEDGKRRLAFHICECKHVKQELLPAPCSTESEGEAPTWPSTGSSPEPVTWGTEGAWQKHWWKWTGGEDVANTDVNLGEQSNALRWQSATGEDLLWPLGCLHHLCHAWRLESRAVHQPGVKAGEKEGGKRDAGDCGRSLHMSSFWAVLETKPL